MRINYKTHPVLHYLKGKDVPHKLWPAVGFTDDNVFLAETKTTFEKLYPAFIGEVGSKVYILRNTFLDAAYVAQDKLLVPSIRRELKSDSGVFIVGKWSFFYRISDLDRERDCHYVDLVMFFEDKICAFALSDLQENTYTFFVADELMLGRIGDRKTYVTDVSSAIILHALFKQFATVHNKVIPAGKKIIVDKEKFKNEIDSDIVFMDITWFTNIISSNGFKVKGHFRLQPKKLNGEWTKELIWITEFEKHGYMRKAGIFNLYQGSEINQP